MKGRMIRLVSVIGAVVAMAVAGGASARPSVLTLLPSTSVLGSRPDYR